MSLLCHVMSKAFPVSQYKLYFFMARLCSHGWMWLARGQKQWHLVTLEARWSGSWLPPMWGPPDINWFRLTPVTIVISIN